MSDEKIKNEEKEEKSNDKNKKELLAEANGLSNNCKILMG